MEDNTLAAQLRLFRVACYAVTLTGALGLAICVILLTAYARLEYGVVLVVAAGGCFLFAALQAMRAARLTGPEQSFPLALRCMSRAILALLLPLAPFTAVLVWSYLQPLVMVG